MFGDSALARHLWQLVRLQRWAPLELHEQNRHTERGKPTERTLKQLGHRRFPRRQAPELESSYGGNPQPVE